MSKKQHYPELYNVLKNLKVDNKDTGFTKSILRQKDWTFKQAIAVWSMLKKYNIENHENLKPSGEENPEIWKAVLENNRINLDFESKDRNHYFEVLGKIRQTPGMKYNGKETEGKDTRWSIPLTELNVEIVKKWGFICDSELEKWYENQTSQEKKKEDRQKDRDLMKSIRPQLDPRLYPFQKQGILFMQKKKRILLADEMGMGKSAQVCSYIKINPQLRPILLIVPSSLKLNWKKELKMWEVNDECYVVNGRKDEGYFEKPIVIINYDIVKDHEERLRKIPFKLMVLDESHMIKSNSAKRTKSIRNISRKIESIIMMSATPITKTPIDLFTTLNILDPASFSSHYRFGQTYCAPKSTGFGTSYNGASNVEQLHKLLVSTVMIRKLKKDYLKDLPDKQKIVIPMELENRKEYNEAERDVIRYVYETKGRPEAIRASKIEALAKLNVCKQLASEGKMKQAIEFIDNLLSSGEKIVVFAIHKKIISQLMEHYGEEIAVKIDGSVSTKKRQEAVDKFQNDPSVKLFVGNVQSAGTGITLTKSSTVVMLELPFSPSLLNQAIDRVHRISQTNNVSVYFLLAENTVEMRISEILDNKFKFKGAAPLVPLNNPFGPKNGTKPEIPAK